MRQNINYYCSNLNWFSDYNEDKEKDSKKSSKHKEKDKDKDSADKKSEESKSQEEKRKHIKSLIERIPTEKDHLFAYKLDWSAIDNNLMERKIRPWINKKIIEYIGEPEPTLVDFICSKVLAGSQPQVILEDVQMVSIICNHWCTAKILPGTLRDDHIFVTFSGIRRRSWSVCR